MFRLFGDAAQQISVRYPASVYGHILDLVAEHTDHPSVSFPSTISSSGSGETREREQCGVPYRTALQSQKDITTSERSMAKLFKEAERLKQVLSANLDYYARVESVHENIDMRVHVTRDEFNQLIDDLMPRVATPLVQAPKMADLQLDQVGQVVLLGGGTRVPKVQEEIQKSIGSKGLGRFLNTDEAIVTIQGLHH
ncbi:hypothetical protein TELCIR_15717 [Teladorsagia circumcincta]|uniref:Hypoxia up-regulated protein 1 n=1 Tax=Teladorsagia circumcincta TaxID=45464 RepID=A0A2G9TXG7_TELCI|nr:hypothetical protein TELCIR_15717 [Teladorsagia circumcincta]